MLEWLQSLFLKRPSKLTKSLWKSQHFSDKARQALKVQGITLDSAQLHALQASTEVFSNDDKLGVLLYGGVGTGKTLLMNALYQHFDGSKKRLHIHQLYQQLMQSLHRFKHCSQPMQQAITSLSQLDGLMCIDDFYLRDIADAKLWQAAFQQWLQPGQRMIITSNQQPNDILINAPSYQQQVQQMISNMNENLALLRVDNGQDYRQFKINRYQQSRYAIIEPDLYAHFTAKYGASSTSKCLNLLNRRVAIKARFQRQLVVFSCRQLFASERSFQDYLALAQRFDGFALIDYPAQLFSNNTCRQRLIWFIDVIYDQGKTLFWFIDAVPWQDIASEDNAEVGRCISRLKQMFTDSPHDFCTAETSPTL